MVVCDAKVLSRELAACRAPSEQALEALRLVEVEHQSTHEVAEILKVSQTRVRQLLDQARGYMVRVSPPVKDEAQWNQQLHVAEALSLERLKWLYRQAMRSFKQSCGPRTVIRVTPSLMGDKETHTTTESFGDTRYLNVAMRISEAIAKIPDSGLLNRAYLAADAEAAREEESEELSEESPAGSNSPLNGDCSVEAPEEPETDTCDHRPANTKPNHERPYSSAQSQQPHPTAAQFTPAHPTPVTTNRPR